MKEVNLLNLPGKRISIIGPSRDKPIPKKDKKLRPTIAYNRSIVDNTSLRFLDGGM